MCLNPIFSNGNKFACRSCNECVETRLNDWVVRALAESAVAGYTYALTLTYADLPTGEKPVGAIVFDYRDVKLFLKRLRSSYERHYGDVNEIRYLACGEQGSKGTQRVHWHVILFSEKDIRPAIKWADFQTRSPVAPSQVVTDSNYLVDVWPNGHIHLQKPDAKGIRYALKYVLKEQSGISKSSGTNRLPRAELWAASLFRMSKKPPIGLRYLRDLVHTLARQGKVYPSMRVHVPSSDGFWYLKGYFAQYWCGAMAQINIDVKAATGASPHGWGALLSAVEEHDKLAQSGKLLEVLTYGSWKSKGPEYIGAQDAAVDRSAPVERAEVFASEAAEGFNRPPNRAEVAVHAIRARHWDCIGRCGGFAPCAPCQRGFSEDQRQRYEREFADASAEWFDKNARANEAAFGGCDAPEFIAHLERQLRKLASGPSQWCSLRETDAVCEAFAFREKERLAAARLAEGRGVKASGYRAKGTSYSGGRGARVGDKPAPS